MPVCEIDLRVGGKYRYEWVDQAPGKTMSLGGVFLEVVEPKLSESKEKSDDDWTMDETLNPQVFTQKAGKPPQPAKARDGYPTQARSPSDLRNDT